MSATETFSRFFINVFISFLLKNLCVWYYDERETWTPRTQCVWVCLGLKFNSPLFLFFLLLAPPFPAPLFCFLPFQLLFSLLVSLLSFPLLPALLFYLVSQLPFSLLFPSLFSFFLASRPAFSSSSVLLSSVSAFLLSFPLASLLTFSPSSTNFSL